MLNTQSLDLRRRGISKTQEHLCPTNGTKTQPRHPASFSENYITKADKFPHHRKRSHKNKHLSAASNMSNFLAEEKVQKKKKFSIARRNISLTKDCIL